MRVLPSTPTTKGPAQRFTGEVWVDMIPQAPDPSRLRGGVVRFAPCARTAWHRHVEGQTICVTEGVGVVAARDGSVIIMCPGDSVWTPPGEWHWHGATPDRFMTHLALSEAGTDPAVPDVEWGDHVTDAQYRNTLDDNMVGEPR
ncbi:cupin domain-containing protein [Nocardia sp. 2YAB30]|uniref:(R)-mandelonitrile lyase n=1 Tax=Nocardia sp. 2YAB30 TaxID=3233022 RepID=UPI003F9DFEBA